MSININGNTLIKKIKETRRFSKKQEIIIKDVSIKSFIFKECDFNNVHFIDCIFSSCSFVNCTFKNSQFISSRFNDVVFRRVRAEEILFRYSKFSKTKIEKSNLSYSKYYNCEFLGVSFNETYLPCSEFANCKFNFITIFQENNFANTSFQSCCVYTSNEISGIHSKVFFDKLNNMSGVKFEFCNFNDTFTLNDKLFYILKNFKKGE